MTLHRIDLEPAKRKFGGDTMLFNGKAIGKSEKPLYDAARWLLDKDGCSTIMRLIRPTWLQLIGAKRFPCTE